MLIHFAFGSLGKQRKIEEQTRQVIELVLREKRLLVSKCKEFIPTFPQKGKIRIPLEMAKVTGDGVASITFHPQEDPNWLNKLQDSTTIHYSPSELPMICLIKISFNQLKSSTHSSEYGKFGLVFTDNFIKSKGIKPVFYYTESSLLNDELIRKWNYNQNMMSKKDKEYSEREILSYRKPATLFSSFKKSVSIKLTKAPEGTTIEYLSYNRYPEGYDFTKEKEYRIIFDGNEDYLYFSEGDLYLVITPDLKSKSDVESFFKHNWSKHPKVEVYPS